MKKGEMLVELMIALGIAVLVLLVIVEATTRSVSTSGFSKRQSEATTYAIQSVECIRAIKNADWKSFYSGGAVGLGSCVGTTGIFTRQVTQFIVVAGPPQQVTVVVTVTWQESVAGAVKNFSARQTTIFTRY